jgi:hypothetical protein
LFFSVNYKYLIMEKTHKEYPHHADLAPLGVGEAGLKPSALGGLALRVPTTAVGELPVTGDELPATVGLSLLGGTGLFFLGSGSSSLTDVMRGRAEVSVTGGLSVSLAPTAMAALPLRKATITCPLVLVPMMRAWAEGLRRGLRGEEGWQNCRIVAPSGV